jgi:hypothetical protein
LTTFRALIDLPAGVVSWNLMVANMTEFSNLEKRVLEALSAADSCAAFMATESVIVTSPIPVYTPT